MSTKFSILFFIACFLIYSCKANLHDTTPFDINNTNHLEKSSKTIDLIAFGSCSDEDKSQDYWTKIQAENPDLWIWSGDIIYADTENMHEMSTKYNLLKSNPTYNNFISTTQIIGTWDDHDYGQNDGNKSYKWKNESKMLLLDFLDVPMNNDVYKHEGVYSSYNFGQANKLVKVILLDSRSFQDILEKDNSGKARYLPSENGDLLGEAQWNWLTKELETSEAKVNIIVSSIQFIADQHGFEKWANFPKSKQRMLNLIESNLSKNIIFISGDRHIGEISKIKLPSSKHSLFDITSSGLTHSYSKSKETNPYRIGDLVVDKNYGILKLEWQETSVKIQCQIKGTNGKTYVTENLGEFKF